MAENRLKSETSPYLLQHAHNPVHWHAWGNEAFAEARRAGKPVLLSVGYAACHWCHVMAHESFEDLQTAAVMNDLFVNIKVDREERPDVDQLYMAALHLLGEQGGWPLTMFLTPDGEPIWGGTYFPREAKYGRPSFVQVMREFDRIYRSEPDKVEHNRAAIAARLSQSRLPDPEGQLPAGLATAAAERLISLIDPVNGGLGGAPKFPQAPLLDLLWRAGWTAGDDRPVEAVLHSLRRMSRGGIYDHLGGGLSRYAVDERWLVPHFEKMLYDNAHFVDLMTRAFLHTGDDLFSQRIEQTVGWLQREMLTTHGAFAASQDADTDGEEGQYYTWTAAEIDAALGSDSELFRAAYDVSDAGNFESRNILNRLSYPFPLPEPDEARLADCRATLLALRSDRIPPARDDKVLADWNGLMIAALARAGIAFDRPDWVEMARRCYRSVRESMVRDGRLGHSRLGGKLVFPGLASDHAAMAGAALALHETSGNPTLIDDARTLLGTLHRWHAADDGALYLAASDADDLVHRLLAGQDDATANHNALAADALIRLYHVTGESIHLERADAILAAWSGAMLANAFAHAGLVAAFDLRLNAMQIVVVGAADRPETRALVRAAGHLADPKRIVTCIEDGAALPDGHPAHGKTARNGRASAYVCLGETCSPPISEPDKLREIAQRPRAAG